MLTSIISPAWRASSHRVQFRFGRETGAAWTDGAQARTPWSVEWVFKRNSSLAPRQVMWFYASLCVLSLGLASVFWLRGATMVMPFAWIEMLLVGVALLVYARHAADSERIALRGDQLTVENTSGSRVECVDFQPAWVRVEPRHGDHSLIDLSGQGRRISVGRFVRPELRVQLADEVRWALRRWQQRAGRGARRDEADAGERVAADLNPGVNDESFSGPVIPRES
ncbi:MAG: DUF2244 domain-containing protein [Burkholderiales bacterium]